MSRRKCFIVLLVCLGAYAGLNFACYAYSWYLDGVYTERYGPGTLINMPRCNSDSLEVVATAEYIELIKWVTPYYYEQGKVRVGNSVDIWSADGRMVLWRHLCDAEETVGANMVLVDMQPWQMFDAEAYIAESLYKAVEGAAKRGDEEQVRKWYAKMRSLGLMAAHSKGTRGPIRCRMWSSEVLCVNIVAKSGMVTLAEELAKQLQDEWSECGFSETIGLMKLMISHAWMWRPSDGIEIDCRSSIWSKIGRAHV